jgi:hypothetical protein
MTAIESITTTVERPGVAFEIYEAQLAVVSFLARYRGRTVGGVPPRPARLLPVGIGQRRRGAEGDASAHRVGPSMYGGPRACCFDDRPAPLNGVRVLPVRPHRRKDRLQPGPLRPSAAGAPDRRTRPNRSELGVFLFTAEQYDHHHAALAVLLGSQRSA